MNLRNLGKTGLRVSELCLGTMTFGRESDERTSLKMVDLYLEQGGNFIDTADVYSSGRSEEILGQALKGRRQNTVLATKVRFRMGDGANEVGASRQHILAGCEASLRRLQTDYIDLYQVHCWDPYVPLEETLSTLNDLVRSGKVRFLGVSNYTAWQLMRALWLSDLHGWEPYVCLQPRYNLVDRHIESELLPVCKEFGLGVIPWAPLGGGFLTGKYRRDRDMPADGRITHAMAHWSESMQRQGTEQAWQVLGVVEEVAQAHGKTISQVAIAWLLAQEGITAPILGARTIDQLKENLAGAGWQLSAEELQRLDQASALPERYPYQFIRDFAYDR